MSTLCSYFPLQPQCLQQRWHTVGAHSRGWMNNWWPLVINTSRLGHLAYTTSRHTHTHTHTHTHPSLLPSIPQPELESWDSDSPLMLPPFLVAPDPLHSHFSPAPEPTPPPSSSTHLCHHHPDENPFLDHVRLVSWHLLHLPLPTMVPISSCLLASIYPHLFLKYLPWAHMPSPQMLSPDLCLANFSPLGSYLNLPREPPLATLPMWLRKPTPTQPPSPIHSSQHLEHLYLQSHPLSAFPLNLQHRGRQRQNWEQADTRPPDAWRAEWQKVWGHRGIWRCPLSPCPRNRCQPHRNSDKGQASAPEATEATPWPPAPPGLSSVLLWSCLSVSVSWESGETSPSGGTGPNNIMWKGLRSKKQLTPKYPILGFQLFWTAGCFSEPESFCLYANKREKPYTQTSRMGHCEFPWEDTRHWHSSYRLPVVSFQLCSELGTTIKDLHVKWPHHRIYKLDVLRKLTHVRQLAKDDDGTEQALNTVVQVQRGLRSPGEALGSALKGEKAGEKAGSPEGKTSAKARSWAQSRVKRAARPDLKGVFRTVHLGWVSRYPAHSASRHGSPYPLRASASAAGYRH